MWLYAPIDTPGHLASRAGAFSANRSPWQRPVPNTTATTTALVPCLLVKTILLDHESPDCFLRRWETELLHDLFNMRKEHFRSNYWKNLSPDFRTKLTRPDITLLLLQSTVPFRATESIWRPNKSLFILINQLFLTLQRPPEVKKCPALTDLDEVGEAETGWGTDTRVLLCSSVSNLIASTLLNLAVCH